MEEQWEQFNELFEEGDAYVLKAYVKALIRAQRTAAQRELLETILKEDFLSLMDDIHSRRVEARLQALNATH